MFKNARHLRWGILLVTLIVEALAFWFGGPPGVAGATLLETITQKFLHPMSWTWVGWASLSMAWLWVELAFTFFSNGRRSRALLKRSDHEQLVFDTGVHWLVLLRDIHLNRLNDGKKEELEDGLFPQHVKRSFAWHAIWWPVLLAGLTLIYFTGWAAWSLRSVPDSASGWSSAIRSAAEGAMSGPLSVVVGPLADFLDVLTHWLGWLYGMARDMTLPTLAMVAGVWLVFHFGARILAKAPIIPVLLRFGARLAILTGVFAVLSTRAFDWLSPLYDLVPHHGLIAMGFFPLTLASVFYFPHILFWTSWRYAIIRDRETHDATLMTLGGVFNSLRQRINLQRIVDTDIYQPWWHRLVDIGDIELKEMGGGEPERIRYVYGPHRMLDEIQDAIREAKKRSNQTSEFEDMQI